MIEVKQLVKRYGSHTALNGISFSLEQGKIYGFLGPNGAGKTTTMNILTGYLASTSGQVTVGGCDILREPEAAKASIGYLPDVPPVYPDMTVREYLGFAAALKALPKDTRQEQCRDLMDRLNLTDVSDRLIANLSKGFRQRVGLAQALLGYPETIILDEPMVGLDPQQIIEMRQLIRSLAEGHTVILSSHILSEVQELCDYLLIISGGELVAKGTPKNLERRFCGRGKIHVEAEGDRRQIEAVIDSLPGIESVQITEEGETYHLQIEPEEDAELRRDIFKAFAERGLTLLSLYQDKPSLEEMYLKLVQKGEEQ